MSCCESGDGMKKVPKLDGDLAESGEYSVNKTKTKKKRKRVGTSSTKLKLKKKQQLKKKKKLLRLSTFLRGDVLYDDRDPTRCEGTSKGTLNKCTRLAVEVFSKTHDLKFKVMRLLRASGDLSMMDLMFKAKPFPLPVPYDLDPNPQIFRARVSFTLYYVDFVKIVRPSELVYIQ
ncbi:hypothetical protein MIMGU_mgv1a014910mg [Erythranthe guttata]|uniref:Uncharacterized protein n=1 Tax=Erythranthe guttata TaxID=4155 RepID=A0A022QPM7_ERYGU|nr:PREDICTED: uncharacterized protein LOC105967068 [Erythranthe guttata]EYU29253.1 hypothetical protein MIMGU_mgv1a014910mg [Erythranthe guttata]|eukprot:XP_012847085.1 PREDICTED: uncharacterized protein LOC105967068 [Erythranthe guttata]